MCVCVCVLCCAVLCCAVLCCAGEQLNVNTSGGVELRMWAGVGQVMAERILTCRRIAIFKDWADLILRVPRFPRTLQPRVVF